MSKERLCLELRANVVLAQQIHANNNSLPVVIGILRLLLEYFKYQKVPRKVKLTMAGLCPDLVLVFCSALYRSESQKRGRRRKITKLLILCSLERYTLNAESNSLLVRICVLQLVMWRAAATRRYPVSYFVSGARRMLN